MKETKALKVIKCQGTDFEIGQQYGEICRADFHRSIEWFHAFSQNYQISKEQSLNIINKFLLCVENLDPQAVEFIKGIAAGVSIDFRRP